MDDLDDGLDVQRLDQNMVIIEKAWRYCSRGIVGDDRPRRPAARNDHTQIREHVDLARDGGLVTIDVGEEGGDHGVEEIGEAVEALWLDRWRSSSPPVMPARCRRYPCGDIIFDLLDVELFDEGAPKDEDEVPETF